jgi:hypothetical protein
VTYTLDPARPHLGGEIEGGDPRTWCPKVWALLVPPGGSVIDVGCGEGHAVDWFLSHDRDAVGVDGLGSLSPHITEHDYTTGPYTPEREFDLAWSAEFVEHVEKQYVPNFMATFKAAKRVAVTAAKPGQGGHHHVNCQPERYWRRIFVAAGFVFNGELTHATKSLATRSGGGNFWTRNGMIFDRKEA